jgi:hypothetical protein
MQASDMCAGYMPALPPEVPGGISAMDTDMLPLSTLLYDIGLAAAVKF